jgi:hypothetical protein
MTVFDYIIEIVILSDEITILDLPECQEDGSRQEKKD